MTAAEAAAIVNRIDLSRFYPFPVTVKATHSDSDGIAFVQVALKVTGSSTPEIVLDGGTLTLDFVNKLYCFPQTDTLIVVEFVRTCILHALMHEVSEVLSLDGERPLAPSH